MPRSDYSWEVASSTPWGEGNMVYFDFDDPKVYLSVPVRLNSALAQNLCQFLRNFSLVASYCGLRKTIGRISKFYLERGDSVSVAGRQAMLAVQLTLSGVESIKTAILYDHAQFLKNSTPEEYFATQFSSLHGWSIHECADYFLRDLVPQIPLASEVPFAKAQDLTNQAQVVRAHYRPVSEYFGGENTPYFRLTEVPLVEPTEWQEQPLAIKDHL